MRTSVELNRRACSWHSIGPLASSAAAEEPPGVRGVGMDAALPDVASLARRGLHSGHTPGSREPGSAGSAGTAHGEPGRAFPRMSNKASCRLASSCQNGGSGNVI